MRSTARRGGGNAGSPPGGGRNTTRSGSTEGRCHTVARADARSSRRRDLDVDRLVGEAQGAKTQAQDPLAHEGVGVAGQDGDRGVHPGQAGRVRHHVEHRPGGRRVDDRPGGAARARDARTLDRELSGEGEEEKARALAQAARRCHRRSTATDATQSGSAAPHRAGPRGWRSRPRARARGARRTSGRSRSPGRSAARAARGGGGPRCGGRASPHRDEAAARPPRGCAAETRGRAPRCRGAANAAPGRAG